MKERQAEYLQAMGIDLYILRQSDASIYSAVADEAKSFSNGEAKVEAEQSVDTTLAAAVEVPLEPPELDVQPRPDAPPESVESGPELESVQKNLAEEEADIQSAPLHFLWQQQGRYLFLSAQLQQPSPQESNLLDAIVASISSSTNSERGEGRWPLAENQKTTETETSEFLGSFVNGRSELCGTEIILVLFGVQSVRQFPEIEGNSEELLGKTLPSEGKIEEFRPVPSLADMLGNPALKSVTWQSIRDLKVSSS